MCVSLQLLTAAHLHNSLYLIKHWTGNIRGPWLSRCFEVLPIQQSRDTFMVAMQCVLCWNEWIRYGSIDRDFALLCSLLIWLAEFPGLVCLMTPIRITCPHNYPHSCLFVGVADGLCFFSSSGFFMPGLCLSCASRYTILWKSATLWAWFVLFMPASQLRTMWPTVFVFNVRALTSWSFYTLSELCVLFCIS